MPNSPLEIFHMDLGVVPYDLALSLQKDIKAAVLEGRCPGMILTLEHLPVLTLGNRGNTNFIHTPPDELKALGITTSFSDRGGEVTAHNVGQLVLYPIIKLEQGMFPKKIVWSLEQSVIDTLLEYEIKAERSLVNPGVWVLDKKICAIGLRVANRVCSHGIALNIENDLSIFKHIVPCGLTNTGVTSVKDEVKIAISISKIKSSIIKNLAKYLSVKIHLTLP